jgi:hypothetical protein
VGDLPSLASRSKHVIALYVVAPAQKNPFHKARAINRRLEQMQGSSEDHPAEPELRVQRHN